MKSQTYMRRQNNNILTCMAGDTLKDKGGSQIGTNAKAIPCKAARLVLTLSLKDMLKAEYVVYTS